MNRTFRTQPRPPRRLPRALRDFIHTEASSGIVLLIAAIVALVWANSPFSGSYDALWHTELRVAIGGVEIAKDLRHWVDEALMAIFFFVVGLEIKRELVVGELNTLRKATLPVVAALGGMVVPALIYVAFNLSGPHTNGWGVPMATDIAFAVGLLALVARAAPSSLRVFLLALAIVDDLGAIIVIALFYSSGIELGALAWAVLSLAAMIGLRAARVWYAPLYVLLAIVTWVAVLQSGIHATIAGVAVGLVIPAKPLELARKRRIPTFDEDPDPQLEPLTPQEVQIARRGLHASVPVAERVAHELHPWSSFVVIPLFALANAGVRLSGDVLAQAVSSSITLGIVAGLVLGKLVGIAAAVWLAVRTGIADLGDELTTSMVVVAAALAGIGFTVALFIGNLAFDGAALEQAKVGVFAASVMSAGLGAILARRILPTPTA